MRGSEWPAADAQQKFAQVPGEKTVKTNLDLFLACEQTTNSPGQANLFFAPCQKATVRFDSSTRSYRGHVSVNCTYDVCVIGAGVVGSSTAHYLASRGQNTLLLEQVSVIILSINSLALNWYHFEIRRIDFLGKYRGGYSLTRG